MLLSGTALLNRARHRQMNMPEQPDKIRIDKWLWAARFFKTRANASTAVAGGKVHVNGARVKPSKTVSVGDSLRIRRDNFEFTVTVRALADRRGSATVAQTLYEESEASKERRAETAAYMRQARAMGTLRPRRPGKRDRRELLRAKRVR